jgi:hypothetical protein
MEQDYQTTKTAGNGTNVGSGYPPNASWTDPDGVTGVAPQAEIQFFEGGQSGDSLHIDGFDFEIPPTAVIDGISVSVTGANSSCYGNIYLGGGSEDVGTLDTVYGGATELWDYAWTPTDINGNPTVVIQLNDVSGGDGFASISLVEMTVFWHIELPQVEADVPTRVDYKVYSRNGNYLGMLPNVTTDLAFPEDINSAGTSMVITCGKYVNNEVSVTPLLTEDGDEITTEDDLTLLATSTDLAIARGDSPDDAIFKNSNRIKAYLYNRYYPNGKLMFSGQVNRVRFNYGGGNASVSLTVYSDGLDLNNFIARGYPFSYTTDVSQLVQSTSNDVINYSKGGWDFFGQTWQTGVGVTNIGAISIMLKGTATVTLSVYDEPNGDLIGSVTKYVSRGSAGVEQFEFAQLLSVTASTSYFWAVSIPPGQTIKLYRSSSNVYANGTRYRSLYGGGGGGAWETLVTDADYYFVTKYGAPTTTTTYSTQDPVTGMASGILQDYNNRGGYIRERDFDATGLSLTYTFVVAYIYDALKKIIELSPTGTYSYVDVGTAEIDIKMISSTADFTVVRGRHINELDIDMTIEQVKNYLLFTGGETSPSVNLFRDYPDSESSAFYGLRTVAQTDNRVTTTATANAIGDTFIEENSDEQQETSLTVLNEHMDITLLTPGKTIGFRNFGNFIDDLVLQVVRRDGNYSKGTATLTLGRLPVRMNDEVERINRQLLNEQTINNPTAPS